MKIVALNGLLGYGYSEEALNIAFSEKVDYLGVDAGSTDPGPYYLGSGKSFTDRGAVKRDLGLALPKALAQKTPFIIGTAGGAGSERHVRWLKEIIAQIAQEKGLRFTLGTVYSDVSKEYVLEKLDGGKISNMSDEVPLTREDVENYDRIYYMDSRNARYLRQLFPGKQDRFRSLLNRDVADPWYTGDFSQTWTDILEGCEKILEELV